MNPLRAILIRLRSHQSSGATKQDIDNELRFHIDQRTAENIAAGMSPDDAAREARKKFGNLQTLREECRETRGASFGDSLLQDVRFGLRMLWKDRGFATIAILTLALGIGANTSMFSLLNILLLRPGPYPEPDRLVRIFRTSPQSQAWPHSAGDLMDYREQNKSFEAITFYSWDGFNLAEPDEPAVRAIGVLADAQLFPVLGVQPELGRVFSAEEEQSNSRVVVLGHQLWRRGFGADTNILGRTVRMDGESVTVIGVMPAGFDYPLLWGEVAIWRPLALGAQQRQDRGSHFLQAFGRMKRGVAMPEAEAELKAICARGPNVGHDSLRFMPLIRSGYSELGQRTILVTFGLAAAVLLIACANLANLQLARAASRWREFAVRTALGAGRARLMRQLLTESVLVSAMGGMLGLLLAVFCHGFVSRHIPYMGHALDVPFDGRVLGFTIVCAVLTGIFFGTAPAWVASRVDVNEALKDQRRGTMGSRRQNFFRQALVVGEVALALVLLGVAGLFIEGLGRLTRVEPGWRVNGLVTGRIALNSSKYRGEAGREATDNFLRQLESRLTAVPGIECSSVSWSVPVWGFDTSGNFTLPDRPAPKPGEAPHAYKEAVSAAYFQTLGVATREGRVFNSDDTIGRPPVAVVNESMARHFWPGESAIGKRINDDGEIEVVGVVNDIHFPANMGEVDSPYEMFRPLAQVPGRFLAIEIRTSLSSASAAAALRKEVAALDTDLAVEDIRTANQQIATLLGDVVLTGRLLAGFAVLGLGLAAIGIYGVISYANTQRAGEFGIRIALGAQRHQVLWLALRQGLFLSFLGTVTGLAGAFAAVQLLAGRLPQFSAPNPMAFGLVTVLLMIVAMLACYLPARRVTKIAPMDALRYE